jgi:hypothetical protein
MLLPWNPTAGARGGGATDCDVEGHSDDDEDTKEHELYKEADDDDVRTGFQCREAARSLVAATYEQVSRVMLWRRFPPLHTTTLKHEGEDVSTDKDLGQPLLPDERMRFTVHK